MSPLAGRRQPRWRRAFLVGLLLSALAALGGCLYERMRLGSPGDSGLSRVEEEVGERVAALASSLELTAAALVTRADLIRQASTEPETTRRLFVLLEGLIPPDERTEVAVTIYGSLGTALAWSGRPSELPAERIDAGRALFVAPGALGLRLVHVHPLHGPAGTRDATIVVERVLSPVGGVRQPPGDTYELQTSIAPVSLRPRYEGGGGRTRPLTFIVSTPEGVPLLEASVAPEALRDARERIRRNAVGVVLALLAGTILLLAAPLLALRARSRSTASYAQWTLLLALVCLTARWLFWLATPIQWSARPMFSPAAYASTAFGPLLRSPIDFLLTALTLLAFVAMSADGVRRLRLGTRMRRRPVQRAPWTFLAVQLAAGAALALLLLAYQWFLNDAVENTTVDILHFSLHPWDSGRLVLLFGFFVFHAVVAWSGVLVLRIARVGWRVSHREPRDVALFVAGWILPAIVLLALLGERIEALPVMPTLLAVAGCVAAAFLARRGIAWYAHAAQGPRLIGLLLALVLPALLFYPSALHFADRAKHRLIEEQFALQAANHPQELQARLDQALHQIDALPGLPGLIAGLAPAGTGETPTDAAFSIWRQTELAAFRLTSAVELYRGDGTLASRFALNLPEYTTTPQTWVGSSCSWEVFGEAAPFGSEERRLLHAERAVCRDDVRVGAVVVHVMLDYSTLPFLSSQNPYFELFRAAPPRQEGMPGRDVELVIYGWGRFPLFTSERGAWPIDPGLFARIHASREPFWTVVSRGESRFHVYFLNDRAGIYGLGYPVRTAFDVCVQLSEIATMGAAVFLTLLGGAVLFTMITGHRPHAGRRLLAEIRRSFYRKLFLAFVAAAVVPVLVLALVIRTYFASILTAGIETEAARTAAVAQRVIEEWAAIQPATGSLTSVSDDIMVWISQVIDQDVNIFNGPRLVATSERDLFASGLLPTRTPDAVYRAIVLDRLPSFVGQDAIGDFRYLLAATPVRIGERDGILTVPLALRQQDVDREIDELDRGVYLAAVIFVLLGGAIGFSMARRIGDPVHRLTRATQRIARGDFDAKVAVRTADELQRLVEAFNRMAVDLKEQRQQLQRTHRLEAWADMARQVAHEIKNPLTPIQLSAEHLRRVHADRGAPLGPVLDTCVDSILKQVRLLRQIASEFSSFATAPTARPAPTAVARLLEEVVGPYRAGLAGRVTIDLSAAPDLPPAYVDPTLIGRAVTNVIENALHAMAGGGRLAIRADADPRSIRIDVSDTGVGMDREALARIFEPYFSTKATGTGLGLTIAKRNVEVNGGTIDVASEKGRGTTVRLFLPRAE